MGCDRHASVMPRDKFSQLQLPFLWSLLSRNVLHRRRTPGRANSKFILPFLDYVDGEATLNSAFEAVHLRQVLVDPADGFLPSVVLEISVEIKKLIFDLVTHHEIFSLGLLWLFRALGRLLDFTRVSQARKRGRKRLPIPTSRHGRFYAHQSSDVRASPS